MGRQIIVCTADPFRVAEGMDRFPWAEATRLFTLRPSGEDPPRGVRINEPLTLFRA